MLLRLISFLAHQLRVATHVPSGLVSDRVTKGRIVLLVAGLFSLGVAMAQTSDDSASGTVLDPSGLPVVGVRVEVDSGQGSHLTAVTRSDGTFSIHLPANGIYTVRVKAPGFETKEMPLTKGATGAQAPLRISLAMGTVNSAINVEGRADDLIGIANSATQGTVGATEI